MQEQIDYNGIPVAFRMDVLKTGGFFGSKEDVLIMYHPDHVKDYLQFLVRITRQGRYAFLDIYQVGGSKNICNANRAQGSLTAGLMNAITGNAKKLEAEQNYYSILADSVNAIVNYT